MKTIFIATLCCISLACASVIIKADDVDLDEEEYKRQFGTFNIESLVKGFGYPFEKHSVTTKDGYILEIHRVQYSPSNDKTDNRPPVLVMHGLLGSSADFFHIGPGKSLPLRLADVGYDVWVGNNRGNTWSTKHQTLNPSKNETFWDFGLDELGSFDSPAIIDYILNQTKTKQLSLVGHSTGASQFFMMLASKPEYNKKVKVMTALGPVVYLKHTTSILLDLVNSKDYVAILAVEKKLKSKQFLTRSLILDIGLGVVCKAGSKFIGICEAVLFLLQGFDTKELSKELTEKFYKTFPAGTSIKELNHVLQARVSGEFRHFDYGIGNLDIYNEPTPAPYKLSKVSVPVGIFYGKNDLIVSKTDIGRLASELQNVVENYQIEYPQFNNLDFLLAKDVDSLANVYIINTLNTYNGFAPIPTTTTTSTTDSSTSSTDSSTTTTAESSSTENPTTDSSSLLTPSSFVVAQLLLGLSIFQYYFK
ncbi:unnamed protein product [Psylliodes chrysocephalus]|uniref:Partial AB-hydrolase lipase domain-containing protein n=1 Tax=Psylliodes chrysocephalus TaxID=3402493 RepID=A0A9P0CMV8_9CUCU|nr:unnamed protein product [Psylliodes chrysocephala]